MSCPRRRRASPSPRSSIPACRRARPSSRHARPPTTRASGSAKSTGPQSAAPTPIAMPGRFVTTASAFGPWPGAQTVFDHRPHRCRAPGSGVARRSGATPRWRAARRAVLQHRVALVLRADAGVQAAIDAGRDAALAREEGVRDAREARAAALRSAQGEARVRASRGATPRWLLKSNPFGQLVSRPHCCSANRQNL